MPIARPSLLALTTQERQAVIDELHSERFQDKAPLEVYATLLDEGRYLCRPITMYRVLETEHGGVKERRRHVQRPAYRKPELLATAPNQVLFEVPPAFWLHRGQSVILSGFLRLV